MCFTSRRLGAPLEGECMNMNGYIGTAYIALCFCVCMCICAFALHHVQFIFSVSCS